MGVYYSTTIAYGFQAPPPPDNYEYDWEWWEDACPEGFQFAIGGDQMSDENVNAVFALRHHIKEVFNSGNWGPTDSGYGVHKLDGFLEITEAEKDMVISAARHLGVDDQDVGFYVLSSVG